MTGVPYEIATSQQALWDTQHLERGGDGGLEERIIDVPNDSAVLLADMIGMQGATIAEVGSAHGRDARYWALQGHSVHCMDFSRVALAQLVEHAERQGVADRINPLHFDANTGALPAEVGDIDSFYSRSALHVKDETLMSLLGDVDEHLKPGGIVLIEGKSTGDPKIQRSVDVGDGLAVDPEENGHLRRVWTPESLALISSTFGWTAIEMSTISERWGNTESSFLRYVAVK